jgi:serine O-acetyltransferase
MFGLGTLTRVAREIRRDVRAAHERDPAARGVSAVEVLALWPGVHALLAHRVAHPLHAAGVPLLPRAIAAATRAATGVEIHPAATIGAGSSSTTAWASSSARRPRSATTSRSTRA